MTMCVLYEKDLRCVSLLPLVLVWERHCVAGVYLEEGENL